jgi:hypothetical protein
MSVVIFLAVFLMTQGGYECEIRESGSTLLQCSSGEYVQVISPALFSQPGWTEAYRQGYSLNQDSIFISVFSNPGNGAVLTVFRKEESGFVLVDEFTSLFEGNCIEFVVSAPLISGSRELYFRMDWAATFRGYYSDPDNEDSFVAPSELSSFLIFATDGNSLRTVYDHR